MISGSIANRLVLIGALLYAVYCVVDIGTTLEKNLWDFEVYYYAAEHDGNIYEAGFSDEMTDEHGELAYKYAPITKYLFLPFTMMDISIAKAVYFLLLVVCAAFLLYVWLAMMRGNMPSVAWIVTLLGFNAALYVSLQTGNISLVIIALIWMALAMYMSGKYVAFIGYIIAASFIKLTPLLFLGLLLIADKRKLFFTGLGIMAGYFAINAMMPGFEHFIDGLFEANSERGIVSPSLYALFGDLNAYFADKTGLDITWLDEFGFAAAISMLLYFTYKKMQESTSLSEIVVLFLITSVLILPRIKNYEYVLLIPIAIAMLANWRHYMSLYMLVVLFVLSGLRMTAPGTEFIMTILWDYYPLILLLMIWERHISTTLPYSYPALFEESAHTPV